MLAKRRIPPEFCATSVTPTELPGPKQAHQPNFSCVLQQPGVGGGKPILCRGFAQDSLHHVHFSLYMQRCFKPNRLMEKESTDLSGNVSVMPTKHKLLHSYQLPLQSLPR